MSFARSGYLSSFYRAKEASSLPKELLHMQVEDLSGAGAIYFHFSELLHNGDSDTMIYKRNWHGAAGLNLTRLGMVVSTALMQDGTGVGNVSARSYIAAAHDLSKAVSSDYVISSVRQALEDAGYTISDKPRELSETSEGLYVTKYSHPMIVARVLWASIGSRSAYYRDGAIDGLAAAGWFVWDVLRAAVRWLRSTTRHGLGRLQRFLPGSVRNFLQL